MAIKKYYVTQYATLNGDKKVSSFAFECEEADLQKILDSLEGGYEVKEVNAALSNMSNADNNATAWTEVNLISFGAKTADGHNVFASVRPFRGAIICKSTVTGADLEANLLGAQVFPLVPTEKATRVSVKTSKRGEVASA